MCGCVTDTVLAQSPRPGAGVTAASWPRERPLPPLPVSLTLCHNPEPSPGEAWSSSLWKLPQQPCCGHQSNTCPIFTEDPVIKKFLAWDKNLKVSDKVRCIPAPICRVAGESFLNTQKTQFYSLSDQPEAWSPLPLVGRASWLLGQPRLRPPPLGSELQACASGGWHVIPPLFSALGDSPLLQLIKDALKPPELAIVRAP